MNVLKMKKLALALGSLALAGVATQASAIPQFYIQPGAITGVPVNPIGVPAGVGPSDNVIGASSELLTISTTQANTFNVAGYLAFKEFDLGSNTTYNPKLQGGFQIYLTFTATAQLSSSSSAGFGQPGSSYSLTALDFTLFADPTANDAFTQAYITGHQADGSGQYAGAGVATNISNTVGDYQLGYGSLTATGTASLQNGGGSVGTSLNSVESLSLCTGVGTAKTGGTVSTDARAAACAGGQGAAFFNYPVPFYQLVFDEFNNTVTQFSTTTGQVALGGASTGGVNFVPVPEPDSLALFGIAAVGLGVSMRRRRKAA